MNKTALVSLNLLFACTLSGCGGDAESDVSTSPAAPPSGAPSRSVPAPAPASSITAPAPPATAGSSPGLAGLPPGGGPPRKPPGTPDVLIGPDETSALPGMPPGSGPPRKRPNP